MAFSPVNAAVLTGLTVTAGQWASGEPLSLRTIIGGSFLAVALAAMNEVSPDLATKFATLIVVVVLFRYGPAIFNKFGLVSDPVYKDAKNWGSA